METKELINTINYIVSNVKEMAPFCRWISLRPASLHGVELEQFVELCEHFGTEPDIQFDTFQLALKIEGVSVYCESSSVPELRAKSKPAALDLIKSILADRKAQANAA